MTSTNSNHWLKDVARHAGLELDLPKDPDVGRIRDAWTQVVRACRLSDDRFTQKVAGHFRIGVADVSTYDPQAVGLIPESVARRHGVLAMSATDTTVVVATSDPTNRSAHHDIVAHASRHPIFLMASPIKLAQAMERAYAPARAPRNALQTLVAQVAESEFQVVTNQGMGLFTSFELEDPAVVKLADIVLHQALRYRATEIHVEPGHVQGRIRYRIDGVLQHVVDLPATAHHRLVARLKHLAFEQPGTNPEDGFAVEISPELRKMAHLLTAPTPDGELVWIRLIDPGAVPTIDDLGFAGIERGKIEQLLAKREGLVLVTGPARSGTTSFIYAALRALQSQSVLSLESRPELVVPGVTQVRYDASTGMSFAESLQHLLDRSPDVIHAGEVRDLATARIVLRTAVTGRKVLATVHTSDAVSGVRRLIDLGLAPGRLAESLHAVVSLRLVRKLCVKCARPYDPAKDAKSREAKLASLLGVTPKMRAVGCRACAATGYFTQIPIPELLVMTPALRAALEDEASDAELQRVARAEGMRTFAEVGVERVASGETTVEELERVLGVVPARDETAESAGAVLLVDGDAQDRQMVRGVLSEMGFQVVEAGQPSTARGMIDDGHQDLCLVIMDLVLPGSQSGELLHAEGGQLLRHIRQSLSTQALPVVVLTSSQDPKDELELLEAGADDYIVKPIITERLEGRIRAVLRRAGVHLEESVTAT
jgi:type II secretory ATPase GspE/PulE/Tfp pilus assembly ATPase PilB-like protein/CheY-like chemotaxis protein